MNLRRQLAVVAVLALLAAWLPAADSGADTCNYYASAGVQYHSGYGWVCGGASQNGCSECYRWTSHTSVESCVATGQSNCLSPAVQHE